MKKKSSWKIIIVTSLIVTAVLLVWLFKDLIILVLSLLLFMLFYFFDEITEKIRSYRLLTHEQNSPLPAIFYLEQAWNLLQKMIHEKQIAFPIDGDTFYKEANNNSYWENQGATAVIRIHKNLDTEIQDEYILTKIAQQELEKEKNTPLGRQNQKLQRIILEKIESKDGYLIMVFHDKNFKTILKDNTAEDLNHDIY